MADETAQKAKRALEDDVEAQAAAEDAGPAGKKQKTEAAAAAVADDGAAAVEEQAAGDEGDADADMADGEAAAEEAGAEDGDEAAANGAAAPAAAAGGPVKLGFRTFANSREAADYLQEILKKATPHRKLNEYESVMLLDLLQMGHPHADEKLAGGLRGFVVAERRVDGNTTTCFHVKRLDNTLEDFSYRKCLSTLFPDYVLTNPSHDNRHKGEGRGRGGRGGSGGRGRGSGGRGRGGGGRGGGRGRGGRGRH